MSVPTYIGTPHSLPVFFLQSLVSSLFNTSITPINNNRKPTMKPTASVSFLLAASSLVIALIVAPKTDLKPWEITRLSSTSPPNRPGDAPGIPSRVALKIVDRNGYNTDYTDSVLAAAVAPKKLELEVESTCVVEWLYLEDPFGREFNCTAVEYGTWRIVMEEGDSAFPSPTTDFKLRILLVVRGGIGGGGKGGEEGGGEVFAGEAAFKVGENMKGLCSAGGMCSFSLKEEMLPFRVLQARVP